MLRSLWGKVRKKKSSGEASRAEAEFGEGKGVHHCSYVLSCEDDVGRNVICKPICRGSRGIGLEKNLRCS